MIKLAPSILSADLLKLEEQIKTAKEFEDLFSKQKRDYKIYKGIKHNK